MYSSASPCVHNSILMYWKRPLFLALGSLGFRRPPRGVFKCTWWFLFFAEPHRLAGGSYGHVKTPRVTTKLGQIPRLARVLSITETANSVATIVLLPHSSSLSRSLQERKSKSSGEADEAFRGCLLTLWTLLQALSWPNS